MSPFEALYHRPPPTLLHHPKTSQPSAADTILQDHSELLRQLRARLQSAQQLMQNQANKHRRDFEFQVGDFVLVRLQHYRQTSVSHSHHKLGPKFFGPFEIIAKVSSVAYTLRLPPSSRIHNTFHISLLRPFIGDPSTIAPACLPSDMLPDPPASADVSPVTAPTPALAVNPTPFLQEKKSFEEGGVDTDQPSNTTPSSNRTIRRKKRPTYLDDFYLLLK